MKRIITILLAFFMIIGITPISAKTNLSNDVTETYARKISRDNDINNPDNGVTPDYSHLSSEEIDLLETYMEENPEFVLDTIPLSVSTKTFYFDADGNEVEPLSRGTISTMTITLYTGKFYDPTYDYIKATATATWNNAPFFRMKDAFAVAWGENFAATSYSCSTYYQSIGWRTGQSSLTSSSPNAGLCYSVNVNLTQTLKKVTINVDLKKLDSSGIANFCATYAHSKIDIGNISCSFTGGSNPSISFSGGIVGNYDSLSKMCSFEY